MYTPTQSLSIDESMVGFKGRLAVDAQEATQVGDEGLGPGGCSKRLSGIGSCRLARKTTPSLGLAHLIYLTVTGSRTRGTMCIWTTSTPATSLALFRDLHE